MHSAAEPLPLFDPFQPGLRDDPYPIYAVYRARDPVHLGRPPMPGYPSARTPAFSAFWLATVRSSGAPFCLD